MTTNQTTQLNSGVLLTSSDLLPSSTFVSLNSSKIPVYLYNRTTGKMTKTSAKGPIKEIRCSPDIYEATLATLLRRENDPFIWRQQ